MDEDSAAETLPPLMLDDASQRVLRRVVSYLESANDILREDGNLDEDDDQDALDLIAEARAVLGVPAEQVSSDPEG